MRKITYLLVLLLLTGQVFISCEKDEDSEPKKKSLIPIKITEYEDGFIDYVTYLEYNTDNLLTKVDYGDGYYNTLEYDSDGRLIKSNIYEDNILYCYDSYEYNESNQIIKIQSYYKDGATESFIARSYYVHEYDINGNVIKKTEYGTNDAIVLYFTFSYDSNGNMINKKYYWPDYQTGEISTDTYEEWIYTYDDKNNIYKSVNMPFLWQSFINNALTETLSESSGESYTQIYTYTYNEENYPIEYSEADDSERYVIEYKEI